MSQTQTGQLRAANDRVDSAWRALLERVHVGRGVGRMLVLLVLAFAVFAVVNPRVFLSPLNLQNMALASPEVGILAIAMMLAMLTGGIDLSLVSIANLTAITVSTLFTALAADDQGLAESLGVGIALLGVAVGALAGLVNGVLIAFVGITPILATLATMQIFNGIAVVWTGGKTLYGAPAVLAPLGKGTVAGIPLLFLLFVVIAVLIAIVVGRTPLGRRVQLQGANPVAARYTGVRRSRVLLSTYLLTGALGGVAGLAFIARNPTASADYGASYVLLVIVIAVLGGTNPAGGFATVAGVVLATMTLQIVQSGFNAIRLSAYEYAIAQGVILIAVMIVDRLRMRRRGRPPAPSPEPEKEGSPA